MRPSLKSAKKKKVKTPGGGLKWHRVSDKEQASCRVCGRPLLGSSRARAHGDLCASCSKKFMKAKVRSYVDKG